MRAMRAQEKMIRSSDVSHPISFSTMVPIVFFASAQSYLDGRFQRIPILGSLQECETRTRQAPQMNAWAAQMCL